MMMLVTIVMIVVMIAMMVIIMVIMMIVMMTVDHITYTSLESRDIKTFKSSS